MIDRFFYWFFGKIDDITNKVESAFITFPKESKPKKKKTTAPEDLFNGE